MFATAFIAIFRENPDTGVKGVESDE